MLIAADMIIELDTERKVEDVQQDFNNAFPYLKLEFNTPLLNKQRTKQVEPKGLYLTIGDFNKTLLTNAVEVTGNMTVLQVEQMLTTALHTPIKILRKSGNIWMGTTITGNWTLVQQNEHAKEIAAVSSYLPNTAGS